jgi:hypothetical protein
MEEKGNTYRVLVGNPKGKRPLGRPRYRCEDTVKIVREIGWNSMDWTDDIRIGSSGRLLLTQ